MQPQALPPASEEQLVYKEKIFLDNFTKQSFHMKFMEQDMDQFHKFHLSEHKNDFVCQKIRNNFSA